MRNKKKYILVISIAAAMLAILSFAQFRSSQVRFPEGRDTLESFGDRTYQMIGRRGEFVTLFNMEYETMIINNVLDYVKKEDKLYIIGNDNYPDPDSAKQYSIYIEVPLKTNTMRIYIPFEDKVSKNRVLPKLEQMVKDEKAYVLSDFSEFSSEAQGNFASLRTESPTVFQSNTAIPTDAIQPTDGLTETQNATHASTNANTEGDEVNADFELIINGRNMDHSEYVRADYEHRYVELPLISTVKELGAEVEWQDKTSARMSFNGKEYHLDAVKGTLVEAGGSINILSVAPGSKHGTVYKAVDDELIIDSDSAKLLIVNIMGARMNIDFDNNTISIN